MKTSVKLQCAMLILSAVIMPVQADSVPANLLGTDSVLGQNNPDHLLLIAFKDESINKIPSTANGYRNRGGYSSSSWSQRISGQIADEYHLQKLKEWPMTEVDEHCVVYRVPADMSVSETLQRLRQDKRVDIAQKMHLFNTQAQDHRGQDPYANLQANLHTLHIDQAHHQSTGKNITIAMIDTGVDLQHPDLAGQISRNENFAEFVSASFSEDKHGTAVAGVMVAKKDNATGIMGIAPDANLMALKACWPTAKDAMAAVCNSFTLALAVNTAMKADVQILNMSLTGPHDELLALLLNKAMAKGMIVVAADTGRNKNEDNFPASLPNVIVVQSLSAESKQPVLAAPGEKILTTLPHGTYDFISGSSIAAAEVSGIIALLLELKGDLTLTETKALLQQASLPGKTGYFPGIDAHNAVLALCGKAGCATPNGLSLVLKKAGDEIGYLTR
jgi:hypothetical protein